MLYQVHLTMSRIRTHKPPENVNAVVFGMEQYKYDNKIIMLYQVHLALIEIRTNNISGDKSNYHTIMTMMVS